MARNLVNDKKVIMIDDDLKIVEYMYAFIDDVDAENERMKPAPKERGWREIDVKRKRLKTKNGHIWKTRYVYVK